MSKILITSDLHFKNHQKYNLSPKFRLGQWITLAHQMKQICLEQNINSIIICGDVFDKPVIEPVVYHYFVEFCMILVEYDVKVYFIHGQHDFDSKSVEGLVPENTYLSNISAVNKNLIYLHNEMREIGGLNFYFQGWIPDFKMPEKNIDVFIGHGYVDGAKVSQITASSNVKNIPCRIAFVGDIHLGQRIKNIVIPGTPFQNSFSDHPDTSLCVFDTDDFSVKRISTVGLFLQFLSLDEDPNDPMIIWKPKSVKSKNNFDLSEITSLNVEEILEELIKDFKYYTMLRSCLGKHNFDENYLAKELKVSLKKLTLKNFFSIDSLELDFENLKNFVTITGENGVGKSSLMRGLIWVLTGKLKGFELEDVIKIGCSEPTAEGCLELEYGGKIFSINRGRGLDTYIEVSINGEFIQGNKKANIQSRLEESLPLISKLHMLYFDQSRDGLLSELSNSNRISLISELSGQNIVVDFTEDIISKIEELKIKREKSHDLLKTVKSVLQGLETSLEKIEDPSKELDDLAYKINSLEIGLMTDEFNKDIDVKAAEEEVITKRKDITNRLNRVNKEYREIESQLLTSNNNLRKNIDILYRETSENCPVCYRPFNIQNQMTRKKEAQNKKIQIEHSVQKFQKQINEIKPIKLDLNKKLEKLDSVGVNYVQKIRKQFQDSIDGRSKELFIAVEKRGILDERLIRFKKYEDSIKRVDKVKIEVEERQIKFDETSDQESEFIKIKKQVFGNEGLLSAKILSRVSNVLNKDENIKIKTTRTQKNGRVKPTLDLNMKVFNEWIPYRSLSGGQRLFCDIYFLSRLINLVGGIGFVLFDESMKYFDDKYIEKSFQILKESLIKNILLIHHGYIPTDSNTGSIQVSLEKGSSIYNYGE